MRLAAPLQGRIEGAFDAGSRHRRAWALRAPDRVALMSECGCVGLRWSPIAETLLYAGKDGNVGIPSLEAQTLAPQLQIGSYEPPRPQLKLQTQSIRSKASKSKPGRWRGW